MIAPICTKHASTNSGSEIAAQIKGTRTLTAGKPDAAEGEPSNKRNPRAPVDKAFPACKYCLATAWMVSFGLLVLLLRIPVVLQHIVQEFSGFAGIFLEPKSVDGRRPSELYQVIWFPKAALDQLMVQWQTIPEVCDIARLGHKLGLRCKTEHAATVFAKIKPGMTFLPVLACRAIPWGTFMTSVAAALKEFGWVARPIQPVTAGQHVEGLLYKVQSVDEPPSKVFRMAHGDVLVTQDAQPSAAAPAAPKPHQRWWLPLPLRLSCRRVGWMSFKSTIRGHHAGHVKPSR